MAAGRVLLFHWNGAEARERAARLRAAGLGPVAVHSGTMTPASLRTLRAKPPAAVVIDLSRLPSHGREVALALRETKATRTVPIVFVDGDPEKVDRIRTLLPEASYGGWPGIGARVKAAVASPPPVVARARMDAYSGTPLPKKLGVADGSRVALLGAPSGFETVLAGVNAVLERRQRAGCTLALWFVKSSRELRRGLADRAADVPKDGLWICWPKKASGVETDLSEGVIRTLGLAAGLVDYKVCSIDSTWSGLRFRPRRKP